MARAGAAVFLQILIPLLLLTITLDADDNNTTVLIETISTSNDKPEIVRPPVGGKNIASYTYIYRPRDGYYIAQTGNSGFVRWWNGILNDVIVNRGYTSYYDYDRRFYYNPRRQGGYWIYNGTVPVQQVFPPFFNTTSSSSTTTTTTTTSTTTTTTTQPPYIIYYVRGSKARSYPSYNNYY